MKTVGIIAEYNPFHNGHQYQLMQARAQTGAEGVAVVLSSSFVQRGEPALCSKWARAELALRGGADVVVELPVVYACRSAEWFAKGGVSLLEALNADFISFGVETACLPALQKAAQLLRNPPPQLEQMIREQLQSGASYPAARAAALEPFGLGALLQTPNNILAVEYLKALPDTIVPVPVQRMGSMHDGAGSATDIRRLLREGRAAEGYMPASSLKILKKTEFFSEKTFEKLALYCLRTMPAEQLRRLPDVGEGLENRLKNAAMTAKTYDELLEKVKTKRYTMSRIKRILLCAILRVFQDEIPEKPAYLRVLAMNGTGQRMLAALRKKTCLPVITKVAGAPVSAMLETEIRATNIYSLLFENQPAMQDFTTSPVVVDSK